MVTERENYSSSTSAEAIVLRRHTGGTNRTASRTILLSARYMVEADKGSLFRKNKSPALLQGMVRFAIAQSVVSVPILIVPEDFRI